MKEDDVVALIERMNLNVTVQMKVRDYAMIAATVAVATVVAHALHQKWINRRMMNVLREDLNTHSKPQPES